MRVSVDVRGVESVRRWLSLLPDDMRVAQARAIRDTLKHTKTLIRRDAAKELNVPQKALTPRLYTSRITNKDTEGKLWAGTFDIDPLATTKKATQGKSGVIGVPRRKYTGSFLGSVYGGQENIWIRKRSKHFDAKLYPTKRRNLGGNIPIGLKSRFPVVKAAIEIEDGMAKVFDRDEQAIRDHFNKRLLAQVNYAIYQAGAK